MCSTAGRRLIWSAAALSAHLRDPPRQLHSAHKRSRNEHMDASARSCAGLKAHAFPPVITSQKISSHRSPVRAAADSARGGEEVRGGARVDQRGHAAAHRPPAVARRLRAERESRPARALVSVWAALAGSFGSIDFAAFALMSPATGRCQCVRCPKQGAPLPCQLVRNECTSQPPRLLVTRRFCSDHAALAAPDVP